MAIFRYFQNGGRRHVGFLKFKFLTVGRIISVELRHHAKVRGDRSNRCRDRFRIFQDGGSHYLGFVTFMPNFVNSAQTTAEIWLFFDFSKMAAVRHLGLVMRVLHGPPTKGI